MSIVHANVNMQRKIKHAQFKTTKMDAIENGEERHPVITTKLFY